MTDTIPPEIGTLKDRPPPRPGPRLPLIPGPIDAAVLLWRRLRRMSTALVLLFILATATLIATFIPQEPVIATTVNAWRDGSAGPGQAMARAFDFLSLFDVFGSWWFGVLTALLMVSLTACLIPRGKAFARNVRKAPVRGRNLGRLHHSVRLPRPNGMSDEQILAATRGVFRRFRTMQIASDDARPQLAIERGHWREFGSLVFHTSFYLLLIAVALGSAFSFTGQIDIVEGDLFADTPLGYQSQTAGRFWNADDHDGSVTTIDDFEVTYLEGDNRFTADEFVSTVTFDDNNGTRRTEQIRVNHPAYFEGLTYYQRAFGFAPEIIVRSGLNGNDLYAEDLILRDDGSGIWRGRAKITQGSDDPDRPLPQIGMEVVFLPDASITDDGLVFDSPEPNNPRMAVTIYSADDLGLDRTVPVSQLDWPQDAVLASAMIRPGESAGLGDLPGDIGQLFEVEFAGLPMWTGLQVSHQPFRWLMLIAASLLLTGLIPSMYAYRRRLWVQPEDDTILISGVALHRKDRFEDEFDQLVQRVADALPSDPLTPAGMPTHADHATPADVSGQTAETFRSSEPSGSQR